jgi:hypothetical protein
VTDAQESWLQTTVTGPGVVAFWWKVSSEGDCDFLEFYVGGALQSRISGEVDWQRVAFAVPAGNQTLRWRYAKDVGTDLGGDAGSVDEVVFVPNSDAPVILLQPASQVVVTGATVNLRVSAAGSATLRYQWFRDATNAISGATSATLTLANVQLTNTANYSVVVTNLQGTATSSSARLTVTTNGPVNNILLFFDSPLATPYQNALNNQARAYQLFGPDDELAFNQAIAAADPGGTLVVVDSPWRSHNFDSVRSFVQAGGRAILQYVYLGGSSAATDFKATVAATLSAPQPVYNWGGTTLFTGLSSPLNFVKGFFLDDGQQLQPTAGGQAAAGYTSGASANQAAVVIGNARRTLVNGFILEEASPSANGVRLAQNEIDFLAGSAQPAPPFFTLQPRSQTVVMGAKATFSPLVSGTAPFTYQWLKSGTNLPGITSATYSLTNVQPEQAGDYQVVVTNLYGAVTSSVGALTLTFMGPVKSILLYCDGAASNPYQSALQALGRPIQLFNINQEQGFSLAIGSADPGKTLAIVDWANQGPQTSGLDTFANAGGRAILSIWYLTNSVSLPAAFGATVVQTYTTPMPVYDWGGSPFFTGVGSPLSLVESGFNVDGQRLQPNANGQAVAGYTSAATANQAALVLGNSGRTILNGFFLEDANSAAAVQLAKNEIQSLLDQRTPGSPVLTSLSPASGRTNGGTVVTLTGSNFLSGATVQFGGSSATAVSVNSSTQVTATTPAHALGVVSVTVFNANGLSATNQFAYVLPPSSAALSSVGRSGASLVMVWVGGTNQPCVLLSATNVAQPRSSWIPVATNAVGPGGLSTNQLPVGPGDPQRFYLLSIPYN